MKLSRPSPLRLLAYAGIILSAVVAVIAVTFVIHTLDKTRTDDVERILNEMRSGMLCVEQQLAQHRLNTTEHHEAVAEAHGLDLTQPAPPPRPETLNPQACAEHHQEDIP